MKKSVLFVSVLFCFQLLLAQNLSGYKVHSHNDYLQSVPFWKAFGAGANSVEADLFLEDGSLFVAHTRAEISKTRDFESLYLEPIQKSIALDLGFDQPFQLLVDIKSEAYSTLDTLVNTLKKYPSIIGNPHISIVISGNRPKPSDYTKYPSYILFDYQSLDPVEDPEVLNKIALVSLSFKGVSAWNGKGRLTAEDLEKVKATIGKAHALGKPFRFWATPDSKTAWKALAHLGVDYINTDMPFECKAYLSKLPAREYRNTVFSEVYRPTFEPDKKKKPVENLILMIGDGNGLTQISATVLANKGETTLTQLKSIGFLKTQSADDFTTDSAAAGTALATGKKAPNRAIGMTMDGKNAENMTELLSKKGYVSAIITTDEISGATPSSFYAHQKDRSLSGPIRKDLEKSKVSLIASTDQPGALKNSRYTLLGTPQELQESKSDHIGFLMGQTDDPNKEELAITTENALAYLNNKKQPFFLMVEGAKIDSYGHSNQIDGVIKEGIGFDKAVAKALQFADTHKNTLVVITADHETGGLTLPQGNLAKNEIEGDFTTDDHTATMVPIFAYGPRSDLFQGVYENNEVFHKIMEAMDIKN
ncbi:alkaline phosphatase [Pseudozobellia thermophila]|uniref:Alkaline phosphatase n=1 Tax=Pseudozobellia thermophila TaxID=192903 RepID=A0A1M6B676_9FLAO|nr:alkaline phosphatase [Pseudozobellia thermophila]SHI44226.1 alkaline phosphatase [Pseudozobellia thermophila]